MLTEPKHFDGRLEFLTAVKRSVQVPVLMKDIIIDPVQIDAARNAGADAVLLMDVIFRSRLSSFSLDYMIEHAHARGLEVLLEAHTENEYLESLQSKADMVGINNRNLKTLEVSLDTSRSLLRKHPHSKIVVCESGFSKPVRARRAPLARGGRLPGGLGADEGGRRRGGRPWARRCEARWSRIKICGLTREADVDSAVRLGADAVGFISGFPASPQEHLAREGR